MTPTTPDAPAAWLEKSRATLANTPLLGARRGGRPCRTRRRWHRPRLGPARCTAERAAALRRRTLRLCAHPGRRHDRRGAARRRRRDHRRLDRHGNGTGGAGAGRAGLARTRRRSAGPAARWRRAGARRRPPADRTARADDHRARSRRRADCDRHPADRCVVCHRARATGVDHRRPRDRQDLDRARHDRQPERDGRDLRVCRDRPACFGGGARDRRGAPARRARALRLRVRIRRGIGGAAMDRALQRHDDRRVLSRPRAACADRDRRPDQARGDPSRACVAHARAAGTRGVSGRHLLSACAPARTCGEAVAGARRRVAHRVADRRNRCGQPVGLHSDQPDLHHRRPDRARHGPVRREPAARHRRGLEREPRRRQGADARVAKGIGPLAPRLFAVPRTGDVLALRRPDRRAHQGAGGARPAHSRADHTAALYAVARARRGRRARRAGRRRIRRLSRRADSRDAGPACGASRCARRDGGGCVERERHTRTRSPGDARRGRA